MQNKILYDTKFLQLKQTQAPNGADWFYVHRPNAKDVVVILPILHEKDGDKLIFLQTKRPPIYAEGKAEFCIEFPAGLVADEIENETSKMAIEKELLEETGYKAKIVEIVAQNVTSSGGLTSETSTYAIAQIYDTKQIQQPVTDGGIIVKLHKILITDVDNFLKQSQKQGCLISSQVYAALYFIKCIYL